MVVANLTRYKPAYNGRTLGAWITAEEERAAWRAEVKSIKWRKANTNRAQAQNNASKGAKLT